MGKRLQARHIAAIYAVGSVVWILASDLLVHQLVPEDHLSVQIAKGLAFVLATTGLIYWLTRQATQAAEEGREQFRQVFDHLPDAVLVVDRDGLVRFVNPATLKRYGYQPDQVIGRTGSLLDTPEQAEAFAQRLATARQGPTRFRTTHRRADGSTLEAEVMTEPVTIFGEHLILCSIRDVTEQHQAAQALVEAESLTRELVHFVPEGIVGYDLELRYTLWNPFMERITGMKAEDVLGQRACDLFPHLRENGLDKLLADALAGTSSSSRDVRYEGPNGTIWYTASYTPRRGADGKVLGVVAAIHDITARKHAEEQLQSFFAISPDLIAVASLEGHFLQLSPSWETMGYPLDELKAKPWLEYVHPDDQEITIDAGQRLARGEELSFFVNRYRTADGSWRWLEWHARAQLPEGRVFALARDITDRKKLEDQLRQSQKMEAVGQLAGGIAHDFNNLLQIIGGHTELGLMQAHAEDKANGHFQAIESASQRATRLVSQLLAFSRRQVLRPEILDLNEVVSELLKMLARLLGEHIRLDFVPGHKLGKVYGDRGMLDQVLMNLCVNARDAMPDGGSLTIETENVLLNGDYCRTNPWARPGRYVLLTVSDTGCGMDRQTQQRIFEPFFTTKEMGHGTGLGLATVYGIVHQHEGMVNVYSEPGQGSTFKVYLPLCERLAGDVGPKISRPVVGGRETILLAEDDNMVRELACHILEEAGYRVLAARDGAAAVEVFEEDPQRVDLVLLDVVMPNLGGRAAFQRMREKRPELPAIFASGYSENAVHTGFILEAGLVLLAKPFAREELLRLVRDELDKPRAELPHDPPNADETTPRTDGDPA